MKKNNAHDASRVLNANPVQFFCVSVQALNYLRSSLNLPARAMMIVFARHAYWNSEQSLMLCHIMKLSRLFYLAGVCHRKNKCSV